MTMARKASIVLSAVAVANGQEWYKTITPEENQDLCLDAPGGIAYNGNSLWLWECNGMASQTWAVDNNQIRYAADESYCIDSGDMGAGTQLFLWECNGLPQQSWSYDSDAMRMYIDSSATCLDYSEDHANNGQAFHIWDCNGLANQEWHLWDSAGPEPTPEPPAAPTMSIVDTAKATPTLSSLVDALVTADLVNTLEGSGPFTVFAPTNDAFAAISNVVDGLTTEALSDVLMYHVIGNTRAFASDLTSDQLLPTVFNGHNLTVDLSVAGTVTLAGETNSVQVTMADVDCTNGVVHIVDAVLIPNGLPAPALSV